MSILTKYMATYNLNDDNYLMLNTISGAVDLIDKETKVIIENMKKVDVLDCDSNELLRALVERGYIFESREEEINELERQRVFRKKYIENIAQMYVICPTTFCNLNCVYCFETEQVRSNTAVMTDEQIERVFSIIRDQKSKSDAKIQIIELFGGEPLLPITKEVNEKIFKFVREENMKLNIITNATHIEEYKELFNEYKDEVMSVQITLDGNKEIHDKRRIRKDGKGTFDVISKGIDILLEIGLRRVNVRVNVDSDNIESLTEFNDFIKNKGWSDRENFHCDIAPVTDHTNSKKHAIMGENEIVKRITEIFPQYEEDSFTQLTMFRIVEHVAKVLGIIKNSEGSFSKFTFCEANRMQFLVFDPSGNIYTCPEAVGDERLSIGNFNEKLELNKAKEDLWSNRNILTIPKCQECNIAPFCGGGCAYASIKTNNDLYCPVCNNADKVLAEYISSLSSYILNKFQ
ncbi:radical SAM protein [Anaerosporobacter sp.]